MPGERILIGEPTFSEKGISALDYPWLHASGSSRQNICGAILENVSHKTAACLAMEFPCWNVLSLWGHIQNGFLGFSSVRIGGLIQIFDADHSTLYADFCWAKSIFFPTQTAEFAYTDAGMHAKQQTEMKITDIVNKKFSSWL